MSSSVAQDFQVQQRVFADINDTTQVPGILVLSSSLLDDRKLLYTGFADELSGKAKLRIWATSARNPHFRAAWERTPAVINALPPVKPFKEFPYNHLRRLNEFIWDFRLRPPSRLSMMRHVRNKREKLYIRSLKLPARALAAMRLERLVEDRLERLLLSYPRSLDATELLQKNPPAVLIATGPNRFEEPGIVAAAKRLNIPVLAFIHSFDNISTKSRMVFKYDGYLLWSEQMKQELAHFYPESCRVPTYIIGAPQFDVFFQKRFQQTRKEFCESQGLDENRPIILYALGSPNFLREHHGGLEMAAKVSRGDLGNVQLLVRPHPQFDDGENAKVFRNFGSSVVIQRTGQAGSALADRFQAESEINEWVNTFRHADVVVNLSSTVSIDAAIFDRPVVNLDYDPEPGQPNQALVKDVNHLWTHFKPIAESGGVWLVNNLEEMVGAVRTYLAHPELHREKRRWIAEYVCGYLDGQCGERLAAAVLDFVENRKVNNNSNLSAGA